MTKCEIMVFKEDVIRAFQEFARLRFLANVETLGVDLGLPDGFNESYDLICELFAGKYITAIERQRSSVSLPAHKEYFYTVGVEHASGEKVCYNIPSELVHVLSYEPVFSEIRDVKEPDIC